MTLCFLLLAHEHPRLVARLARILLTQGGMVVLHVDRKAPATFHQVLREELGVLMDEIILAEPVSVAWGEWSMVEATLNGLRAIEESGRAPHYVHLISGSDYPLKRIEQFRAFLARNAGKQFIESIDADRYRWVKHGWQQERYLYRHWVSYRRSPALHTLGIHLQRRLRLEREFPKGFRPHLGSQWWTLGWPICQAVLSLTRDEALMSFFKSTAVPDELFFQTVVRSLVPDKRNIDCRHLTLYQFSDYGAPLVYCDGHEDYLLAQPFFFARKLSPHAKRLRDSIDERMAADAESSEPADRSIGRPPKDYQRFLVIHASGLFGRRSMGRVRDAWYGDLEWNTLPYFVLIGDSRKALNSVRRRLNLRSGILCHGELFRADHIDFAGGVSQYAGYSADDVKIRDHKAQNFLVDILQETRGSMTGFSLFVGDVLDGPASDVMHRQSSIGEVVAWDPNCTCVVVRTDPIDLFLREFGDYGLAGQSEKYVAELFGRFYQRYLEDDGCGKLLEAARLSGAPHGTLTLAQGDDAANVEEFERLFKRLFAASPESPESPPRTEHSMVAEDTGEAELRARIRATVTAVERRFHREHQQHPAPVTRIDADSP